MLAPVFVTAIVSPALPESFARPYLIIGLGAVLTGAVLALCARRIAPETPYADMAAIRRRAKSNPAEIFREGRAWLFLLSAFMNLAFQTGLTTWLPRYCSATRGYDFTQAGLTVTLYFLGALAIRLLSPVAYAKIGVRRFYCGSLLSSTALYLVFMLLPMPDWADSVSICLLGFLLGATVPSLIIICCDAFPERTASASSIVVFGVSLASMTAPVLVGRMMTFDPHIAMLSIAACPVIAALALPRQKKPPA